MSFSAICNICAERPDGCWKAAEYGCACEYRKAEAEATNCPVGKWDATLDLNAIPGIVYTAPWRAVAFTPPASVKIHVGPKFDGDFRVGVARDYGRLLAGKKPPFLLLEDDCVAQAEIGELSYPIDADLLYLGGGKRGVGHAHLKHGAKRSHGYSYADYDSTWIRIWGMLYTHALLFLTEKAIDLASKTLATANRPGDQLMAVIQHDLVTYCLQKPLYVQSSNNQTWSYFGGATDWTYSEPRRVHIIERLHRKLQGHLQEAARG